MARPLFPILLSAAAFATAWWAGTSGNAAPPPGAAGSGTAGGTGMISDEKTASPSALTGLARRGARLRALENPAPADVAGLLESPGLDAGEIRRLAGDWTRRDPAGFWKWLNAGGKERMAAAQGKDADRMITSMTAILFKGWFKTDTDAAIGAWRGIYEYGGSRHSAAMGMLSNFLDGDEALRGKLAPLLDAVAGAPAWFPAEEIKGRESEIATQLLKLPPGSGRDGLLRGISMDWLARDWKAAAAFAGQQAEPFKSQLLGKFAIAAFEAEGIRAQGGTPDAKQSQNSAQCAEWARNWFETETTPELRKRLGTQYVGLLAAKDPAAALTWAQENLSAKPLAEAVGKVLEQRQYRKDPAAARALVESLPPGGVRETAAFKAAGAVSAESVTWLLGQVDRDATDLKWGYVGDDWAKKDAAAYQNWLAAADPEKVPRDLVSGGLSTLIEKDAAGAMDWVLGTRLENAPDRALRTWGWKDPAAAADWLNTHGGAAAWDAGSVGIVAKGYFGKTPAAAADWAAALPPGPVREASLAALRSALAEKTGLSPEERTALSGKLGGP